ncbi:hypothetical protein P692DRAFT_20268511 [Suillus brevipes Sb2]|nr:hypothetical protein P692DRAFT_20268511 [Suillus brevipes Sb2]
MQVCQYGLQALQAHVSLTLGAPVKLCSEGFYRINEDGAYGVVDKYELEYFLIFRVRRYTLRGSSWGIKHDGIRLSVRSGALAWDSNIAQLCTTSW